MKNLKFSVFNKEETLNKFMSLGREYVSEVRLTLQNLFNEKNKILL